MEIALSRVGFGAAFFVPKSRFIVRAPFEGLERGVGRSNYAATVAIKSQSICKSIKESKDIARRRDVLCVGPNGDLGQSCGVADIVVVARRQI